MGRRRGGWESEGWGGRPLVTILLDAVPRVSRQESIPYLHLLPGLFKPIAM